MKTTLSYNKAMKFHHGSQHGILIPKGMPVGGSVTVKVYYDGKYKDRCASDKLLYQTTLTRSSPGYAGDGIRRKLDVWGVRCARHYTNSYKEFLRPQLININKADYNSWSAYDHHFPVTVELTVVGALTLELIEGIRVPGINQMAGVDFGHPGGVLYAINNGTKKILDGADINVQQGDKIKFFVSKSIITGDGIHTSKFHGLPKMWTARFGWDVMYYVTESVNPGDLKPYLGFDSQVHSVFFRNFEDQFGDQNKDGIFDFQEQYWKKGTDYYTWEYTASALTSKNLEGDYEPYVKWEVAKKKGEKDAATGQTYKKTQRHDQRIGVMMNLLEQYPNAFQTNGIVGDFQKYPGTANRYYVAMDPDEFLYLDRSKTPVTENDRRPDVVKVDGNWWHTLLPEEAKMVEDGKNGQAGNLALNYMVTAYQRQKSRNSNYPVYKGHEVEGDGLFIKKNGDRCMGKTDCYYRSRQSHVDVKAPGKNLEWRSPSGRRYLFDLDVRSRIPITSGFYSSLLGTEWPSVWEKDVPYTLIGLQGISAAEFSKYSMVLEYEDELGYLHTKIKHPSRIDISKALSTGRWTEKFDMEGFGNYNVTVYYQRNSSSEKVPIAGKELNEIELRFLAVNEINKTYDGSRGDGAFWYMQDGIREYTVTRGTTLKFEIADSDPHTFRPEGLEFYLNNRAKAKRIPNDSLADNAKGKGYLQWYIDNVRVGGSTTLNYKFSRKGQFKVKVEYRNASSVTHIVNVVDYNFQNPNDGLQKGSIKVRDLTSQEKSWFLQNGVSVTNKKIAYVDDVLSKYAYDDAVKGNGTYDPKDNFVDSYGWKSNGNPLIPSFIKFERESIFPRDWIRHTAGSKNDAFKDIADSRIETLKLGDRIVNTRVTAELNQKSRNPPEAWNLRFPWIATTKTHGYLVRTNIKSVIDLPDLFDQSKGGFTGRGNAKYGQDQRAYKDAVDFPIKLSDEQINRQIFYNDLLHERKILIPNRGTLLEVRNKGRNKDNRVFDNFIATIHSSKAGSRVSDEEDAKEVTNAVHAHNITAYPNPVKDGKTKVTFGLAESSPVTLEVTDVDGRVIYALHEPLLDPGSHMIELTEIGNKATGLYFIRLTSNEFSEVLKLIYE